MEVHETSWPILDHEATTAAAMRGDCVTEPSQPEHRHGSNSHDQEWADFLHSYSQGGLDNTATTTSSDKIGFRLLGVDDNMPTQFGAMNDYPEHPDPVSTTTNSSLSSSMISDPNGAPHTFPAWPVVGNAPLMSFEQTPFPPAPWMAEQHQQHHQPHPFDLPPPLAFSMTGREGLGIHMPPTSQPIDTQRAMHFGGPFIDHDSPIVHNHHDDFKHDITMAPAHLPPPMHNDIFAGEDLDDREASADPADPCYAQLLFSCLKEAPDHTLSLRELYDWVQQHSQKAKDPKNRGWQNSVRHNLSMNAAFQRVAHSTSTTTALPKKGSLWRLTPDALAHGVISTTRYRKDPKRKPDSHHRRHQPALNRQTSGAKGGRATRDAKARERARLTTAQRFSPYHSSSPSPVGGGSGVATPRSPYFAALNGYQRHPEFEMLATSAPHTPPEWVVDGGHYLHNYPKPPLPLQHPFHPAQHPTFDAFGPVGGGETFEFLPLDLGQGGSGLFGDVDPEGGAGRTPTPSLMTEGSWEDGNPALADGRAAVSAVGVLEPPSSVVVGGEGGY